MMMIQAKCGYYLWKYFVRLAQQLFTMKKKRQSANRKYAQKHCWGGHIVFGLLKGAK